MEDFQPIEVLPHCYFQERRFWTSITLLMESELVDVDQLFGHQYLKNCRQCISCGAAIKRTDIYGHARKFTIFDIFGKGQFRDSRNVFNFSFNCKQGTVGTIHFFQLKCIAIDI